MNRFHANFFATLVILNPIATVAGNSTTPTAELKGIGDSIVRQIDFDICLPATAEEYSELGKHAILLLNAESAISTELPIRSVYVIHKGVRIPLQRFFTLPKKIHDNGSGATQSAFYLLPIQYMKSDAKLLADFNGERKSFGITSFSAKEGLDTEAPAFARLDAYDTPFDPDLKVVEQVILREFPSHFQ